MAISRPSSASIRYYSQTGSCSPYDATSFIYDVSTKITLVPMLLVNVWHSCKVRGSTLWPGLRDPLALTQLSKCGTNSDDVYVDVNTNLKISDNWAKLCNKSGTTFLHVVYSDCADQCKHVSKKSYKLEVDILVTKHYTTPLF